MYKSDGEDKKEDEMSVTKAMAEFNFALKAKSKLIDREIEDFKYALGDQWKDEDKALLEKAKISPVTDNQIAPNLYLLTGLERQNRTDFKAFPEGEEDGLKAEIASYLFKKSIEISSYSDKSSEQFKDGITCGESHLELYLDNDENLLNGKPLWKKLDGGHVIVDPASREYDFSDAKYVFKVTKDIEKEDVASIYPEKEDAIMAVVNGKIGLDVGGGEKNVQKSDYPNAKGYGSTGVDSEDDDCVDLIERYYKKSIMKSFIGDRKTGAIREAEDKDKALSFIEEYKRSIEEAKMNFKMAMEQKAIQDAVTGQQSPEPVPPPNEDPDRYLHIRKNVKEIWMCAFIPGMSEVLTDERAWFYPKWKKYPIIPFYGRFSTAPLSGDDRHLLVQGLVHGVKNAQDRHNKATMLTIRHLNGSVNSGWISEEDTWVDADKVRLFGTEPGVNLEYKSGKPRPERILPSPISTAHAEISKDALAMMKSSLGINADLLAVQQGGSDSGRAIALRQKQGLLMVQELFDNLSRSRKMAGQFVLSQMGKIFDTDTAKKILGDAFLKKNFPPLMLMNPETNQQEPMKDEFNNPMEYDKEMADLAIADVLSGDLGSYDVSVGEAVSSETLRMANSFELKDIAKNYPGLISPELIIEESQLPQSTKNKVVESIKSARMAQQQMPKPGMVPSSPAEQGGING